MTPCIEWQGARTKKGYGSLYLRLTGKTGYAHRVMYELTYGPIPIGHEILHSCDNPPCVNPLHLSAGTRRQNVQDMLAKGRARNGATRPALCSKGHSDWYTSPAGERNCRTCKRNYQKGKT